MTDLVKRANYLPVPHVFALNQACMVLAEAFDHGVYLVGSCLHKRDYRDVDVRAIVSDEMYERMFPGILIEQHHPLWSVMCAAISLYLEKQTGLPIDFQIQKQTVANHKYPGERHALGMFLVYQQHKTDRAPAGIDDEPELFGRDEQPPFEHRCIACGRRAFEKKADGVTCPHSFHLTTVPQP